VDSRISTLSENLDKSILDEVNHGFRSPTAQFCVDAATNGYHTQANPMGSAASPPVPQRRRHEPSEAGRPTAPREATPHRKPASGPAAPTTTGEIQTEAGPNAAASTRCRPILPISDDSKSQAGWSPLARLGCRRRRGVAPASRGDGAAVSEAAGRRAGRRSPAWCSAVTLGGAGRCCAYRPAGFPRCCAGHLPGPVRSRGHADAVPDLAS